MKKMHKLASPLEEEGFLVNVGQLGWLRWSAINFFVFIVIRYHSCKKVWYRHHKVERKETVDPD